MSTLSDILDVTLVGNKRIGSVTIPAIIGETYTDTLTVTSQPISDGISVSDHAYLAPREITLTCGWSNADYAALGSAAAVSFDDHASMSAGTYIDAVYSQLLRIQSLRKPVDVVTSRRKYSNMLLQKLSVIRSKGGDSILQVDATLQQVIVVSTESTKLPPRENQANPKATAETKNVGAKAAAPATPTPGGAVVPS